MRSKKQETGQVCRGTRTGTQEIKARTGTVGPCHGDWDMDTRDNSRDMENWDRYMRNMGAS